jgi:hypothetical protein
MVPATAGRGVSQKLTTRYDSAPNLTRVTLSHKRNQSQASA